MPNNESRFDEIRPYHNHEVNEVLTKLTEKPSFYALMAYFFPHLSGEAIAEKFINIKNTHEFQEQIISHAIKRILRESTDRVTISGLENIKKGEAYLFLSNHRDIILDSAILNIVLFDMGFGTTRIAIGDNLMVSGLVTDLMKLNKSFVVHRNVPRNQLYEYSERLSAYIRMSIGEKSSIWLAQKSGRTKDGNDQTSSALMKMLSLSGGDDFKAGFKALNIVPMTLSYEFEPCDNLKAEELLCEEAGLDFIKDDKMSMIRGIREPKGRVHLSIGKPINPQLSQFDHITNRNEFIRHLVELLDQEIHQLYRLWPSNYIAHDLLNQRRDYTGYYSQEEKEQFRNYLRQRMRGLKSHPQKLYQKLLSIYAWPVMNKVNPKEKFEEEAFIFEV
ncbi:MAG: 1-acyl-sn-glycerol-3-phosphate acyltransferase [Bacteroidetes bacterium]|nr:1-acyl-sn-glycerol-3-phosphate acyltransferase [Bacteroidota bacterium]